jgi:hypothetical protein
LIFSCKSTAQSDSQSGVESPASDVTPVSETPVIKSSESESSEPEEIAEAVEPYGIIEEALADSDVDVEDESEETLGETLIEVEPAVEPEEEVIEEPPEAPIREDEDEQGASAQAAEESVQPTESSPPPIEPQVVEPQEVQPPAEPSPQPQIQQPPATTSPAPPPPAITPPPATPPATPPAQQGQVPEQTAPRDPPLPPPFLGPAEPERTPPVRQEVPAPVIPELPSLPRDETPEEPIVFSRVVRMTVGQMLDVPFRGTGWVYLGELGNRRGLSYDSRRLDVESGITVGQSFIFRAETAGTYILKFYRQDFIQDYIINDYVQVIVGEADDSVRGRTGAVIDRGRVVAEPRWPAIPEAAGSTNETVSPPATEAATGTPTTEPQRSDAIQNVEQASPATSAPSQAAASPPAEVISPGTSAERAGASEGSPPDEYVRQAKQEFDAGRVEQALAIMEQMRQRYPSVTDEAWWLLGQLYEANSPARDIRQSLECYRTLINEYPQSSRVDDARRRIAYLERYYLNIR